LSGYLLAQINFRVDPGSLFILFEFALEASPIKILKIVTATNFWASTLDFGTQGHKLVSCCRITFIRRQNRYVFQSLGINGETSCTDPCSQTGTMGALHELAECHDWDGVKELLLQAHQRDKNQHQDEDENACENGRHNSMLKQRVSTQDTEGGLVVHYPELYQSVVSGDIVKIIIHAYPQALSQPRSVDTLHYPLHVALETMLLSPPQKYLANEHNGHHEDRSGNENHYSRICSQTITEMLSVASEIAGMRNRSRFLPLHYAAQLNNQDVFEQVRQAYPEAAVTAYIMRFLCILHVSRLAPPAFQESVNSYVPIQQQLKCKTGPTTCY
jgi:hypothetical protein